MAMSTGGISPFGIGLGLGVFHRPACIAILLPQLGRLVLPAVRDASLFERLFLGLTVALLGRRDDGRIDQLAGHGQIASIAQRLVEAREQDLARPDLGQRFAEGPDRVGVRHRIAEAEPEKAHPRQAVAQVKLGALITETVLCLQDQHLEHEHMVERRPSAFRAIRPRHRPLELGPKQLEVDHRTQPLQLIALGRQTRQPLVEVEETRLSHHPYPPSPPPHSSANAP
jgi:hypothetical protein